MNLDKEQIKIDFLEEVKEEIKILMNLDFICRFIGIKLGGKDIKAWIEQNWKIEFIIKFMLKQFFIVIFCNEEIT